MEVRTCVDESGRLELRSSANAARFLVDARRADGELLASTGDQTIRADLRAGECLTYRVDLAAASASNGDRALGNPAIWLLEPSSWLWQASPARAATLVLELPHDIAASVPWRPLDASGIRFELPPGGSGSGALTAFGRLARQSIDHAGGRIELAVLAPPGSDLARRLTQWQIEASGLLLQAYGRLPLPSTQVLVVPRSGASEPVPWAQSNRSAGVALQFHVDAEAPLDALRADWTAAHEYAHLMHPYLGREGSWLAEGLASYYQNLFRARAGLIGEDDAWRLLHAGFARGASNRSRTPLSQASRSMRAERSFMRIYWTGAAFWLEADVALRRSGVPSASVDAALAHFANCCLPQRRSWAPAQFVAELDRGLGLDILVPLFERYRQRTDFPDIASAGRELGLGQDGSALPDAGPAAATLRRAIMAPREQVEEDADRP